MPEAVLAAPPGSILQLSAPGNKTPERFGPDLENWWD